MMNGEIKNIKPLSGQMPSPKTLGGDIGGKIINIGEDGATFVPNMSENGILSWTNNKNLENPPPVNIKGKDGKDGKDGTNGKDGINGIDGKDGAPGKDGIDGKDGFSPIVSVTDIEGGHKVTIADKEGEKTFDVMDGKDGQGGGGVTSWNDLTDKPFGEELTEGIITFDGDYSKHEYVDVGDDCFCVRISDKVMSKDEVVGSTVRYVYLGRTADYLLSESDVISFEESGMTGVEGFVANVLWERPNGTKFSANGVISIGGDFTIVQSIGLPFTKEGTYFMVRPYEYYVESLSCLTGLVETTKILDEKYLPESVVLESELNSALSDAYNAVLGLGYQTEEQVTALINNALGVIENARY